MISLLKRHKFPLLIGFCAGLLMAFPLAMDVLGTSLPDGAGDLWGSALGAIITIAGAFWLTQNGEAEGRVAAKRQLMTHFSPVIDACDEFLRNDSDVPNEVNPNRPFMLSNRVQLQLQILFQGIDKDRSLLARLSAEAVAAALTLDVKTLDLRTWIVEYRNLANAASPEVYLKARGMVEALRAILVDARDAVARG